jgi:hypothetical protein
MHPPKTHAIMAPVNTANNDVRRQRRIVGITIAKQSGKQCTEIVRTEVVGAQDNLLANGSRKHLGGTFGWGL